MKTSNKGIELIKKFEGLKLKAYKCPAGVLTIGYGHTGGVKATDVISNQQAESFLISDLEAFEKEINAFGFKLNQNQFDALISFCYNLGVSAFVHSSIFKLIKIDPNTKAIGSVWNRYVYANKQILSGLVARRKAESELYYS